MGKQEQSDSGVLWPKEAESLGYGVIYIAPGGFVYSMETANGYRVVRGSPSYKNVVRRSHRETPQ